MRAVASAPDRLQTALPGASVIKAMKQDWKLPSPLRAVEEGGEQAMCKVRECLHSSLLFPQGQPVHRVQFNDGNATVVSMWVCRALRRGGASRAPCRLGWTLRAQDWPPRGRPTCCTFSVCCPH